MISPSGTQYPSGLSRPRETIPYAPSWFASYLSRKLLLRTSHVFFPFTHTPPCFASCLQYPGGPRRSVEDLKERYYAIARKLLVVREGGESAVANHTIIRYPYSK